ncbi:MAG: cation transporter [Myxococcales bacterium]|nr:cation transporter [Myxococcales bacterium]
MSQHHRHAHAGDHDHDHAHQPADFGRAFAIGIGLNVTYVAVQVVFGLWAGSMALLADAGHNLSDVLALAAAWLAATLARRAPSPRFTYGLRRSPILASLFNALLLLVSLGAIALEALRRLTLRSSVDTEIVIWVAAFGVLINFGTGFLFLRGSKRDLNLRGAFLHMMTDGLITAGVLVAALVIRFTGWQWLDPAVSLLLVAVIFWGTWGLLRDAVKLSLDAVPDSVDRDAVIAYLQAIPGVCEVHDLHIWPLSTTEVALTAHLVMPDGAGETDAMLDGIGDELRAKHGIAHCTVQVERGSPEFPCRQASANEL